MGRHNGTKEAPTLRSPEEVERLVNENIRLVHHFKLKFASFHDEAQLLSEGMRGLHRAAQTWDPAKGISFGTYASMRIKWYFMRLFHPPASQRRGVGATMYSLDCETEGGRQWHELLEDQNTKVEANADSVEQLMAAVAKLAPRDRRIIGLRFGLGGGSDHTLDEVAVKVHLTRERVRQLEAKALAHIACIIKGIPFKWDYRRFTCPALNGHSPVSGAATRAKSQRKLRGSKNLRKSR